MSQTSQPSLFADHAEPPPDSPPAPPAEEEKLGRPPLAASFAHDTFTEMGVELVLAVMQSASTDVIRAQDWWMRARTALETGAGRRDFGSMVSRMADKLQIEALNGRSVERIHALAGQMLQVDFGAFRAHVRRDAVFIVAMAQARRAEERSGK